MKRWLFTLHVAFWIGMSLLSFHFKTIAEFGLFIVFLIMALPHLLFAGVLGMSEHYGFMFFVQGLYLMLAFVVPVLLLTIGVYRMRRGRSGLINFAMHLGIAAVGLVAVVLVGSINFKFVI